MKQNIDRKVYNTETSSFIKTKYEGLKVGGVEVRTTRHLYERRGGGYFLHVVKNTIHDGMARIFDSYDEWIEPVTPEFAMEF